MKLTEKRIDEGLFRCRSVLPILARVGDKWTVLVIVALRNGPCRFNELKRNVQGVSQQMLTRTLKALERDGMVVRTTISTSPPQVKYELSSLGKSLSTPVFTLGKWVEENLLDIDRAQREYDGNAKSRL
ncbi:MAG TPA: helix-turn-helix domain-containing protein [Edaphobacter sp.]